jgi:biotin carboxylase
VSGSNGRRRRAGARVVMVGFARMLLTELDARLPPGSVAVVEDPDVIEKRSVVEDGRSFRCVAGVVPARHQQGAEGIGAVESHLDARDVEAVLPGLEYGVRGAAALAERWALPGASIAASRCLTDKLRLREAAAAAGLRNPEWREVFGPGDVRDFAPGRAVVLKPAGAQASLGVQLLAPGDDVEAAWEATAGARDDLLLSDHHPPRRYLAEHRIVGREYSVEALVRRAEITFLNVTAKRTAPGRHPVELGHVVPADLPSGLHGELWRAMEGLVGAVGFDTGVLHAEWIVDGEGAVLVECAGRLPGDSIVELVDAAYGCDLVSALVAVLSGRAARLPATARRASAIRFLAGVPGRVGWVEGLESARARPGVTRATVSVAPGDEVREMRSSWDRIGEVVAVGRSAAEAERRAGVAAALVRVATSAPSAAVADSPAS